MSGQVRAHCGGVVLLLALPVERHLPTQMGNQNASAGQLSCRAASQQLKLLQRSAFLEARKAECRQIAVSKAPAARAKH